MPHETSSTPATDPAEALIRQWSEQLRRLPQDRRDELEDHLRSELQNLNDTSLSPRERVVVAADRLGQPLLPASHATSLQVSVPAKLMFAAILLGTPVLALFAGHGAWEFERELDDWFGPTGDAIQDAIRGFPQALAMLAVLSAGTFAAWKLVQRQRRLA
ncbi:MAG: hypothetical protein AAGE65_02970 [Planctomycetota bacterium]